ncbi:MAG: hypothetical protein C0520_00885 [Sphingopyxis sp.]|nr:hypothetical protein [Sphingopyxis sp.]
MNRIVLGACALTAATLPATAMAAPAESNGFGISLTVPVVCDLDARDFVVDAVQNSISGYVEEFCNSARGFQVLASHRPLGDSEVVELDYGGDYAQLERAGISSVAFRSGPRLGTVPVRIQAAGLESQLAVSFSITAI